MNARMWRSARIFAAALLAVGLVVGSALPALGYNEENVQHVRLVALDRIRCGSPIRLQATLTDRQGNPVVGARVNFSFKKKQPGDLLAPTSGISNAQGKVQTTLTMAPSRGVRQIVAAVASPGKAKDQFTISAAPWPNCGRAGGGGGGVVLPPTGIAQEAAPFVSDSLPMGIALALSLGILALLYGMRRTRGSRTTRTP